MHSAPLNPYVAGGPLSDPSGRGFYGREDIFDFVRSALLAEQRTPILLYGQRRIGKSSVLRQIPNHLPPEFVCVYYDLQGKSSMQLDQVLYGLGRAIADGLKIPRPQREEATEETFADEFLVRAIHALDDHPERLLLLFDEFDVIDEKIAGEHVAARRFMGFLGDLISREPRVGYILVVGRKTEELSEGFNSTLLKNSVQHRIGRLERGQTARLVHEPSQGYLRFTDGALEKIYNLAAGHPFCTQLLCYTIWSAKVKEGIPLPTKVTAPEVEAALLPAIDQGTNGLNWIFDGLTNPAHRLFLSALVEVSDPVLGEGASFSMIEKALASRQVAVDTVEMNRAPRELETWDVIESGDDGFRCVVPMVGAWIRRERSLDQLEKEVRYVNPRAYRYYELAVEAHRKADLDRAITDYKGALEANPVFLEAQMGLATALRERGDLDAAIEAYERVLELAPDASTTGLLQALMQSLESAKTEPDKLPGRYKRIRELEPNGPMQSRAERVLRDRAVLMLEGESYKNAANVFEALGDDDHAKEAVRKKRLAIMAAIVTALIGLLALSVRYIFAGQLGIGMKILLWAVAGSALGSSFWPWGYLDLPAAREKKKPLVLRGSRGGVFVRLLSGVGLGTALGYIFSLFFDADYFDSQFIAFLIGGFINPIVMYPLFRQQMQIFEQILKRLRDARKE